MQGNATITTSGPDATVTIVHTDVVSENGTANVIRTPIEAVATSDAAPWNWAEGIRRLDRFFRSGGRGGSNGDDDDTDAEDADG